MHADWAIWRWSAAVGLLLITVTPALAELSSLIVIPTADVTGEGRYRIDGQVLASISSSGRTAWTLNNEFGIGDRFEAGVDFDLTPGDKTLFMPNFKYTFPVGGQPKTRVALGYWDPEGIMGPYPFTVATRDFGIARLHLGLVRGEYEFRWLAGTDRTIGNRLTLMADYTNGWESAWSVGGLLEFGSRWGLLVGVIFPNSDGPSYLEVQLIHNGQYKK